MFSSPEPTNRRNPSRSKIPIAASGANLDRKATNSSTVLLGIDGAATTANGAGAWGDNEAAALASRIDCDKSPTNLSRQPSEEIFNATA